MCSHWFVCLSSLAHTLFFVSLSLSLALFLVVFFYQMRLFLTEFFFYVPMFLCFRYVIRFPAQGDIFVKTVELPWVRLMASRAETHAFW